MDIAFHPGQSVALVNLHRHCENSALLLGRVRSYLVSNGYPLTATVEESEIVIFNTCALTDEMIGEMERTIRAAAEESRHRAIVILGCLATFSARLDPLRTVARSDLVLLPVQDLASIDRLFYGTVPWSSIVQHRLEEFDAYQPFVGGDDAFVMIAQGCVNHCSYCNIRNAKGTVRSRPPDEIVAETEQLCAAGHHNLVLLADDCGSYGIDMGTDLAELIAAIVRQAPGARLKVYTIFPALLLRLWVRLREHVVSGNVSYLCLPVQSGSPRVLERMDRSFDLTELRALIADIREHAPEVELYTHFIVGFPTETEGDFEQTLDLAALFDAALFIRFGENSNTPAAGLIPKCDDTQIATRRRRLEQRIQSGVLSRQCAVLL